MKIGQQLWQLEHVHIIFIEKRAYSSGNNLKVVSLSQTHDLWVKANIKNPLVGIYIALPDNADHFAKKHVLYDSAAL